MATQPVVLKCSVSPTVRQGRFAVADPHLYVSRPPTEVFSLREGLERKVNANQNVKRDFLRTFISCDDSLNNLHAVNLVGGGQVYAQPRPLILILNSNAVNLKIGKFIIFYCFNLISKISISASAVTLLAVPHGIKVGINDVPSLTIFIVDGAGSSDP